MNRPARTPAAAKPNAMPIMAHSLLARRVSGHHPVRVRTAHP
jgi:hypothetical protein